MEVQFFLWADYVIWDLVPTAFACLCMSSIWTSFCFIETHFSYYQSRTFAISCRDVEGSFYQNLDMSGVIWWAGHWLVWAPSDGPSTLLCIWNAGGIYTTSSFSSLCPGSTWFMCDLPVICMWQIACAGQGGLITVVCGHGEGSRS